MESLLLSWNAVAPLFFIVVIGIFLRRREMLSPPALKEFNRVCFNLFLSTSLFTSIYDSDLSSILNPGLVVFCLVGVGLEFLAGLVIVHRLTPSGATRGAMMQSMFRTNLVLVGLPIASGLYGGELGPFPLIIAVLVPIYNVLGVAILEYYRSGSARLELKKVVLGVVKNPMVIGAMLGILCVVCSIRLPQSVESTVNYFSRAATVLALLILGASLQLGEIRGNGRMLSIALLLRLGILPVAAVCVALGMGYRGIELISVLMVFGCPLGTVTYVIAQQMDSDAELAGELVLFTTLCSCLTLFLQIFALSQMGLI